MTDKYTAFYQEYRNKLFSYLVYKSGNYELSRDIVQESFTRHFHHYGREAVISPALLFTIARHALVDHLRQQNKFQVVEKSIPKTSADAENSFIAREKSARVYEMMNRLPEQDREILTLAVTGVAYKEIAATFELNVANVKVRVHRARTRLRQMINDEVK
jgi:RNA polymerase sigma-70 factor (ECF subfamily)